MAKLYVPNVRRLVLALNYLNIVFLVYSVILAIGTKYLNNVEVIYFRHHIKKSMYYRILRKLIDYQL